MNLHKYTVEQLREAVASSTSVRMALKKLNVAPYGGNYQTFHRAINYFNIDISHFTGQASNAGRKFSNRIIDISEYLTNKRSISSHKLRLRLIADGIFSASCSFCGLSEWNSQPISLELDHINGDNTDNSIGNLRILCPNCHAQTSTYRGRNIKT